MASDVESAWIGIDLGTQSVRVIALSDDGVQVAAASRPLTSRRDGVRHEQDPAQWWSATCTALREVTGALAAGTRVRAVAVSATSGTVVVVDDRGRPLTAGIMYDDARGAAFTDRANDVGGAVWSRLGYRMQASWALPTILSLQSDGILTSDRRIVHQPDLITSRLTGERAPSDSSHALKTGLDLDTLQWPVDVMGALGVPLDCLPEVVASGTVIGAVDALAAEETGLPAGCAVVAGMTDGCAAQLAAGAISPGSWNSVLGTTLVIKGASRERRQDPTGAVYAHRAPFAAGWFPGGASSTGAGALTHWLPGRDLDALTAAVPDGVPVAYPLVGTGERFPFVSGSASAFFEEAPADDAARFSAIAHGTAYVERLCYDLLDLCGYDVTGEVSFTGGGSRNPWWNQVRCDVLGRPVRIADHGEGAIGMALLAAAALDDTTPADRRLAVAAERLLPGGAGIEPSDAASARADGYRAFLDALDRRRWVDPALHAHASERAS